MKPMHDIKERFCLSFSNSIWESPLFLRSSLSRLTLPSLLALFTLALPARADHNPNFNNDAKPILRLQPQLLDYVRHNFEVRDTGLARIPGNHDQPPQPPFIFQARPRGSSGPYFIALLIQPGPVGRILKVVDTTRVHHGPVLAGPNPSPYAPAGPSAYPPYGASATPYPPYGSGATPYAPGSPGSAPEPGPDAAPSNPGAFNPGAPMPPQSSPGDEQPPSAPPEAPPAPAAQPPPPDASQPSAPSAPAEPSTPTANTPSGPTADTPSGPIDPDSSAAPLPPAPSNSPSLAPPPDPAPAQ